MTYDDWKAPKQDRQTLIWPAISQILDDARSTSQALERCEALVAGTPLRELRAVARTFAGLGSGELTFLTGHQCELWHPGVWVKNVLIDSLARRVSGRAMHLAVDSDAPKHLELRWLEGDSRIVRSITDDPARNSAEWASLLAPPSPVHLREITGAIASARLPFEPMVGGLLDAVRTRSLELGPEGALTDVLANALHRLDWLLGLDYLMLTLSPMLESDAWLTLVLHLIENAPRFAHDYNTALAQYRTDNGIRSASRPMPDLGVNPTSVELPLWLDDLDEGVRARASVDLGRATPRLVVTADVFELDRAAPIDERVRSLRFFLRRHRLRLAPRAMTLTLFARLLLADVFVHGVGGGRYDQVTDRLIAAHFGITPPPFAVATATLYWPGSLGRTRSYVHLVEQEGHRLRHGILGGRKRELTNAIAALPRRSRPRSELFAALQQELRAAWAADPRARAWHSKLEATRIAADADAGHFDREVTYAFQTAARLAGVIDWVRKA